MDKEGIMKTVLMGLIVLLLLAGCGTPDPDVPEMNEFMKAVNSPKELTAAIAKFSTGDIVPAALTHCKLGHQKILHTEERDGSIFYTVEATVEKCDKSESAVGTIRVFDLGWKNGKIVDFNWHGPKSGQVEY